MLALSAKAKEGVTAIHRETGEAFRVSVERVQGNRVTLGFSDPSGKFKFLRDAVLAKSPLVPTTDIAPANIPGAFA